MEPEIIEDQNVNLNMKSFMYIQSKVGLFIFSLWSVYFLEYCCTVAFADVFTKKMKKQATNTDTFLYENSYIIYGLCYQTGVLISRSSLGIVKIWKVWVLSILQAINFVIWFLNATFFIVDNYYIMFAVMIWTGLLGGGAYVNVLYCIWTTDSLPWKYRELGVMICTVFNDLGILTASITSLILEQTLYADI